MATPCFVIPIRSLEFPSSLAFKRSRAIFLLALALRGLALRGLALRGLALHSTPRLFEITQFFEKLGLSQSRICYFVTFGVVNKLLEGPLVQGFVMQLRHPFSLFQEKKTPKFKRGWNMCPRSRTRGIRCRCRTREKFPLLSPLSLPMNLSRQENRRTLRNPQARA